jgi:hypothetical protein
MSYDWGPHYLVPTNMIKTYSGAVQLREELDEDLLHRELLELELDGPVVRILNPWYYRQKGSSTWIKIGESANKQQNFPVRWDTAGLKNGQYQILGLMHVFVKRDGEETAVARENIIEVAVQN